MTQKAELGKLGEDLACRYLVDKNYKIIERNYRKPWGELDIIAKSPDKTLVFIEVKTTKRIGNQFGNQANSYPQLPNSKIMFQEIQRDSEQYLGIESEMQMTSAKIKKLKRTASLYAGHYPELIDDAKGWRIDLLALTIQGASGLVASSPSLLTISDKNCVVKHYENI